MKRLSTIVALGFIFLLSLVLTGCNSDDTIKGHGEIYVDKDWKIYSKDHTLTKPIEIDFWSANSAVDIQGSTMAEMVQQFI